MMTHTTLINKQGWDEDDKRGREDDEADNVTINNWGRDNDDSNDEDDYDGDNDYDDNYEDDNYDDGMVTSKREDDKDERERRGQRRFSNNQ